MSKTKAMTVASAAIILALTQVGFASAAPDGTGNSTSTAQDAEKEKIEQQTKLYQLQEAMYKAREAASKAEAASVAAGLGPLSTYDNSKTGAGVTFGAAGQTAGSLEGNLLAASATQEVGDEFAERLCHLSAPRNEDGSRASCKPRINPADITTQSETPVLPYDLSAIDPCESLTVPDLLPARERSQPFVFLSEGQNSNFEVFETLMVRLTAAGRQMCNALDIAEQQNARSKALLEELPKAAPRSRGIAGGSAFLGLETAATALNTLQNLFRTEYSVAYHSITPDNLLLIKETVSGFMRRRPNAWVHAPELFPLAPSGADNPLEAKLKVLDGILGRVVQESGEQARLQATISGATTAAVKGDLLARANAASDMHKAHKEALVAAAKVYTDYLSSAAQGADGKQPLLAIGLRQARAAQMLKSGGVLVLMKMNLMGATTYTKKNFFTAFGGMPFYASGGVIASYAVMDGRSGRMLDAASIPVASGFQSVPAVHRTFRSRRAQAAAGK